MLVDPDRFFRTGRNLNPAHDAPIDSERFYPAELKPRIPEGKSFPPDEFCPYVQYRFRRRKQRSTGRTVSARDRKKLCNRFGCCGCGKRRRRLWGRHLIDMCEKHGLPLWMGEILEKRRDAIKQAFVRICDAGGHAHILATIRVSPTRLFLICSAPYEGLTEYTDMVEVGKAIGLFAMGAHQNAKDTHPFSTCRAWKLRRLKPPPGDPDIVEEDVCRIDLTPAEYCDLVERIGLERQAKHSGVEGVLVDGVTDTPTLFHFELLARLVRSKRREVPPYHTDPNNPGKEAPNPAFWEEIDAAWPFGPFKTD
jgi:hypothetical protein